MLYYDYIFLPGDQQGYGTGDRGQDRTREALTVNNYIYGVANCLGTNIIIHFSQEVLEALVEGALARVLVEMGVLARVPLCIIPSTPLKTSPLVRNIASSLLSAHNMSV